MRNSLQWIGFMSVVLSLSLASCGDSKPAGPQAPPPTPVDVYTVATGNATYFDSYPGTATPLNQVDIKPQVSGNIVGIYFKDGQQVRKGQKLYEIDQQQYQAAVEQAKANLNVSRANLAKAQQDADRYSKLARYPIAPGSGTGFFVPDWGKLFVSARRQGEQPAEILVYETK